MTLVGRSNVGKSTLLNRLIGQKISITSRKPQTTRSHLLGIKSNDNSQILYIDTPGLQKKSSNLISRYMNREIFNALVDVDVVVHVIEAMKWKQTDHEIMTRIQNTGKPLILAINKIDKIDQKSDLLTFIGKIEAASNYVDIIPLSAKTGKNIDLLEAQITRQLPPGEKQYPDDQISNRNERYFAAEFIREKLTRQLGDEVPYNISVVIDQFSEDERIITIHATIWVATSGQKRIVIGKDGEILKKIGIQARKDMEQMFGKKVFLETWVKIKKKWITNPSALKQFGYEN